LTRPVPFSLRHPRQIIPFIIGMTIVVLLLKFWRVLARWFESHEHWIN
jgi:hypothetical protein